MHAHTQLLHIKCSFLSIEDSKSHEPLKQCSQILLLCHMHCHFQNATSRVDHIAYHSQSGPNAICNILNISPWLLLVTARTKYCTVCITALYYFIQILYRLFESRHHVAADKLVNIPTKMAASSVERCWWTVCGDTYLANKSYRSKTN